MNTVSTSPLIHLRPEGTLWRTGLVAASLSAVTNAVVFSAAVGAGIFPSLWMDPSAGPQMSLELILLVSVVASFAAVGVFALMARALKRPMRPYLVLAAVVLVASFAAPFAIPGTAALQVLVLNAMHVVVAGVVAGLLVRRRA
jgi:hypothetical protein